MAQDELPLFPVTGWEIGPIPAYGAIMFRPSFLAGALQALPQADPGRRYVLTADQARELVAAIEKALRALESGAPPPSAGPRH